MSPLNDHFLHDQSMTELHDVIVSAGTKCSGQRKQEQLSIER